MILTRYGSIPGIGTFGKLQCGVHSFATVEQPWRDNKPFESCVPNGTYNLVSFSSPKFGEVFAMVGATVSKYVSEKARYACLFHQANWPSDVKGCVGIGKNVVHIKGLLAVNNSQFSLQELFRYMAEADDYTLTIQYAQQ